MEFHSRQLKHAYEDKFGDAAYIEFMRRRLVLMRELLSSDGSLYLHIGHQMLFHLKVILDEVFGRSNFRNLIVRKKCSSKNYTKNQYANLHDYILFYTKSKKYKWNQPGQTPSKEWIEREYPKMDERGRYKLVPIHAPGTRNGETGTEWRGRLPPRGKHWQYTPTKLEELHQRGEIYYSKNDNPRRKVYLPREKALPLTDYWDGYRDAHHQSIEITGYPTEKNLELLKVIIGAASEEGDLVLDPFAGSGSTLHAANDLGRQWFGIDESLTAAQASLRRLRHGLAPMGDFVQEDKAPVVDLFERELKAVETTRQRVTKSVDATFELVVDEQLYLEHQTDISDLANL
jgi:adenine-specific DNA-methyltransferase